jgi:hypothetical protein
MNETSEGRPRPTPRPRPGARPSPSPRPRVAGSRRDRDEPESATPRSVPAPRPRSGARPARDRAAAPTRAVSLTKNATRPAARRAARSTAVVGGPAPRRGRVPALVLAVLCLLAAGGVGFLGWQRTHPPYVTSSVFDATRSAVQALYAYDYKDSDGSVQHKLAVLTGDLHDQYAKDLSQGGIIDTYKQVSATTSYEVLDVGLQQINQAQDAATLVVFGQYVVKSVNSGNQPAPQGSECQVTPEGAQSCTQTVQVHVVRAGGNWKISELTLVTTS